jgi:acyl-coenzyme A thioesterase PaaI-like protein
MSLPLPPYAALLGLKTGEGGHLTMAFGPHLIGSPGRLHGGAVAGLMEIAANAALRAALAARGDPSAVLKPINVTVDYLREGAPVDTHARATILRAGRRVANLRVEAWQQDESRPIAAARMNILIQPAGG